MTKRAKALRDICKFIDEMIAQGRFGETSEIAKANERLKLRHH